MKNSRAFKRAALAFFVLSAFIAGNRAYAEEATSGVLSIVEENNLFYHTDRDYTNGTEVIRVPNDKPAPDWILRVGHWIPWFPEDGEVRHGYAFGQNLYTPSNVTLANPPSNERPYAGWLYGSVGVGVVTGRELDALVLTLGVVGPAAGGEQTQKMVHTVVDAKRAQGWDTQLHDEPGLVLTYEKSWRGLVAKTLIGNDFDVTPHVGGALANVYTYANMGLMLRYGNKLPLDYGPPRIQPSLPGSGFLEPTHYFEWYFFAGFDGRAVARDIFLDGNTYQDSRRVKKEPLVDDVQWGIAFTWRAYRLTYTHVQRSREFKGQNGADNFGALCLSTSI